MRAGPVSSTSPRRKSASRRAGCFATRWPQAGRKRRPKTQAHRRATTGAGRRARDRRAISTHLTPNGSCVVFATPPRAAEQAAADAPSAFLFLDPDTTRPKGVRTSTSSFHSTPIRPPRNTNLHEHISAHDAGSAPRAPGQQLSAGPGVQQRGCLRRRRAANEHVHRSLRACTDPVFEWALPRACWQPSPPAA